jgi:hypothetical protein
MSIWLVGKTCGSIQVQVERRVYDGMRFQRHNWSENKDFWNTHSGNVRLLSLSLVYSARIADLQSALCRVQLGDPMSHLQPYSAPDEHRDAEEQKPEQG